MKKYSNALVLGLGTSGESAARLLLSEGARVTVVDAADDESPRARAVNLKSSGAHVLLKANNLPSDAFDVCVVSPGIELTSPWLREIEKRGIPLIPELELGWSRRPCPVIAVTGTNGKSTVVKWLVESLEQAGQRAAPAGNYGPPITHVVTTRSDLQWLVVEVSSFQLETTKEFRPDVGILLNILPNHLDRHGDMATYMKAKARLFANTRSTDTCLVHDASASDIKSLSGGRGHWHTFGLSDAAEYIYRAGQVLRSGKSVASFEGTRFANDIMGSHAAAVVATLGACGVGADAAVRAAKAYKPLPHRMEEVAVIQGVKFINDSKATTLSAMAAGLSMCGGKARLIAGGLAKETDFAFVKEVLAKWAAGVYLMGRASEQMASAWSSAVPCVSCGTLEAALANASREARAGETVLLSPGCASFDQFRNFEERGDQFKRLVRNLAEEEATWKTTRCHGVR